MVKMVGRSFVVWTLTEERERAELANRKHLNGLIFKFAERRKRDPISFPPRFSIASDEQPVPAIGLESSS